MMGPTLKDIIDLDYLIRLDEALDSHEEIHSRAIRDRKIFHQCKTGPQTGKTLLLTWLRFRREEFFQAQKKKGPVLLPGTLFSSLYTALVYAAIVSGGISGMALAYSFLAYHGTRPINVAVFMALFVVLPAILILLLLVLIIQRALGTKNNPWFFRNSILHALLSSLLFTGLPHLLKRAGRGMFKKNMDALEYTASLIRIKHREYKDLFFWPICLVASLFAFCFSFGVFCATFFRVIVSDMAFGWQSTLMTTSARIHDITSFIALPWSWFMPQALALPSLEQIEGSRIILKDGISVLATRDLVSWWPFLCMSVLFYAVIPRALLIITGILARNRTLEQFNFERPRFRQVIVRMQSPVLDIDADIPRAGQEMVSPAPMDPGQGQVLADRGKKNHSTGPGVQPDTVNSRSYLPGQQALVLASKKIYTDAVFEKIIPRIQAHLFSHVKEIIGIDYDYENDSAAIQRIKTGHAHQVILLHEVWQPPIRGLLHYITQIKSAMPQDMCLCILLTRDPGQEDLAVSDTDMDFKIWKTAIARLGDPDIMAKRFL